MTSQSLEEPMTTPTMGEAAAEDSLTTPDAVDACVGGGTRSRGHIKALLKVEPATNDITLVTRRP
jgi:tryptophan synthase beta subunit